MSNLNLKRFVEDYKLKLSETLFKLANTSESHYAIGVMYNGNIEHLTNIEKAKHHFEKALLLDENYCNAMVELGIIAYKQNDKATAQNYFTKAKDKGDINAKYWLNSINTSTEQTN